MNTAYLKSEGPHPMGTGEQRIYEFPNGYGASVIRTPFSYGGDKGLYELAVLDSEGKIAYDTPITKDVIGHLTEDELESTLTQIRELPVNAWKR